MMHRAPTPPPAGAGQKPGLTGAGPVMMKSYKDVPVADVDMIFPELDVTVWLNPKPRTTNHEPRTSNPAL